uniref:Uncharacterized protein n=1 Tax=Arundo donax TaxID=35708 RepID=A0A0A8Y5C6_ARUDO
MRKMDSLLRLDDDLTHDAVPKRMQCRAASRSAPTSRRRS